MTSETSKRRQRTVFHAFNAMICATLSPLVAESNSSSAIDVERLLSIWGKRQQAAESLMFEWVETHIKTEDAHRAIDDTDPTLPRKEGVSFEVSAQLLIDGDLIRYHSGNHNAWDPTKKAYIRQAWTSTFDGRASKALTDNLTMAQPQGEIYAGTEAIASKQASVKPILFAYRALKKESSGIDTRRLIVSTRKDLILGRNCIMVGETGSNRKLWVDPSRDYTIARMAYMQPSGRITFQMDISYVDEPVCGWAPLNWSYSKVGADGTLVDTVRFDVTNYRINPQIEKARFDLEFPPGTVVVDMRNQPGTSGDSYVVGNQGERRPLSELRQTVDNRALRGRRLWVIIGSLAFLVVVGDVLWKRLKK